VRFPHLLFSSLVVTTAVSIAIAIDVHGPNVFGSPLLLEFLEAAMIAFGLLAIAWRPK
jgi:hypothetical protein